MPRSPRRTALLVAAAILTASAVPLVTSVDSASASSCAPTASDRLVTGQSLTNGHHITSASGAYTFGLDTDGTIAIRSSHGGALWKQAPLGARATLQVASSGELTATTANGVVAWRNYVTTGCASVVVLDDGRVVAVDGGVELWSIPAARTGAASADRLGAAAANTCAATGRDRLVSGQTMAVGGRIVSPSGKYTLALESGGTLALRSSTGGALWQQGPYGAAARFGVSPTGRVSLANSSGQEVWREAASVACLVVKVTDDGHVTGASGSTTLWSVPRAASSSTASGAQPSPTASAPAPTKAPTSKPTTAPAPTTSPTAAAKPTATATAAAKPTATPPASAASASTGSSTSTGTRVAAYYPFASSAVWNVALGSGAKYTSSTDARTVNLLSGSPNVNSTSWSIAVAIAKSTDPLATVTDTKGGGVYTLRIPRGTAATGGSDGHVGVIQPDGYTAYEFYKFAAASGTDHYTTTRVVVTDLRGDGLSNGARASATSIFGGLIRADELARGSIRHALAVAVPASMLKTGPVWPAHTQDTVTSDYSGLLPMGSMVALPPTLDVTQLGLSPDGVALAHALQDYGAYVLLQSSKVALYCELSCDTTKVTNLRKAWNSLYPLMRVVTNSTPDDIAGGGTRRQPALPALR